MIELLVVIAIISILMAMLLPALKAAKDAAKTILCKGNFRQNGLIVMNYCTDFNNDFPPYSIKIAAGSWEGWPEKLRPYSGSPNSYWARADDPRYQANNLLYCPAYGKNETHVRKASPFKLQTPDVSMGGNGLPSVQYWNLQSYDINNFLSNQRMNGPTPWSAAEDWNTRGVPGVKIFQIKQPSITMLMAEKWTIGDFGDWNGTYFNPRHNHRLLFVRVDGSVSDMADASEYDFWGCLWVDPTPANEFTKHFWACYLSAYETTP